MARSTKHKLGFIRGIVPRSPDDASLQEQWDTCNNLLETRFALSNGSHKYKLNRETYDTMQSGKSVSEYYTSMKCIWEELDSMNELPNIVNITLEIQLFLKGEAKDKCTICDFKWHPPEKCWEKVGYPTWHHKFKQNQKAKSGVKSGNGNAPSLPHFNQTGDNSDTEHPFGKGTVYCFSCVNGVIEGCIIDIGASDHMLPDNNDLDGVHVIKNKQVINLPNGHTFVISKVGNVTLENKLELKNVLIVPSFKFRLLLVSKLTKDSQCFVTFYEQLCVIQDLKTRKVLGLGKKKASLYHLLNLPLDQIHAQLSFMVVSALEDCSLYSFFSNCSVPNNYAFSVFNNKYSLWNHRLGHVSNTTLKHIPVISKCVSHAANESCLTCPMAKFAKLPYSFSDSHAKTPFQLVHIDIWGPYKVSTLGHHKYLFDHSR
ncbi:hypothetical protein Tco_1272803 [Tanacetum coccineum]